MANTHQPTSSVLTLHITVSRLTMAPVELLEIGKETSPLVPSKLAFTERDVTGSEKL